MDDQYSSTTLVACTISGFLLGIDARRVSAIDTDAEVESLDIGKFLGCDVPPNTSRRVMIVQTRFGIRRIIVGESARLISIPTRALVALPPFLEGLATRLALQKIFIADKKIGFMIDVDKLAAQAENGDCL